jgi:molybdenum cofactor biosynthesis enzyme MoaA
VRLTGGEPLVRKDLTSIVASIRSLGVQHIGITTNGLVLKSRVQVCEQYAVLCTVTAVMISVVIMMPRTVCSRALIF